MTEKNKYKIHKKLEKIKQMIIIALMVISGIWYVTKGREKDSTAYAFTEQKTSEINMEKTEDTYKEKPESLEDSEETFERGSVQESEETSENRNIPDLEDIPEYSSKHESKESSEGSDSKAADLSGDYETGDSGNEKSDHLINLNHATQKELETLPGVGPATAKNIIDYREKYGGFADIEEIKNVKRIGDKTFEKLKEYITV